MTHLGDTVAANPELYPDVRKASDLIYGSRFLLGEHVRYTVIDNGDYADHELPEMTFWTFGTPVGGTVKAITANSATVQLTIEDETKRRYTILVDAGAIVYANLRRFHTHPQPDGSVGVCYFDGRESGERRYSLVEGTVERVEGDGTPYSGELEEVERALRAA